MYKNVKNYQALYVFFEKSGIVTDDVLFYLQELKKVISDILVIVNGKITPEGRHKLETLGVEILVRQNQGLDFGAWKAGLTEIGWQKLTKKDGLLLCNCSCFGPIYPFAEIFTEMDKKDCDFWGINRHPEIDQYLVPNDKNSKVIEHLQSYFLFFKPRLFNSKHFRSWWENLVEYSDYEREVGYHETKFTRYLEDAGFKSDTYMDFKKYNSLLKNNASIQCCDLQLIEDRCPLIKKRIFSMEYICYLYISTGQQVVNLMSFLKKETTYDVNLIWNWIIRNNKLSTLKYNLHLNYILPTQLENKHKSTSSLALVLYIYYEDLIDYCFNYAQSMPENTSIYVIVAKDNMKEKCYKKFQKLKCSYLEVRQMKNQGRDVAAYLVVAADVFEKYDYICCMHDKKTPYYESALIGHSFAEHCFQSNLYNKTYVKNLISTFDDNPKLGMLVPPILDFGLFSSILGNETVMDIENIRKLYQKLNFTVPIDDESVIPFGTMFWVRGKAFLPIFRHKWEYADFPPEPNPNGGTILHAIERFYPTVAQEAGYYVGVTMPDSYASTFLDNQLYMLRTLNKKVFDVLGRCSFNDIYGCNNLLQYSQPIVNNLPFISPKELRHLKVYSRIKYYFYLILSKISFGKKRKKLKHKKNFWKQNYLRLAGEIK